MGIRVEFDPELALRNISEFKDGDRKFEECIPEKLIVGGVYNFLKTDQRNYWLFGEVPLIETKGGGVISRPLASINIQEVTHFVDNGIIFTKGKYVVNEIFMDDDIHFEGTDKVGVRYR